MDKEERKTKYPILSVRIKPSEMAYLRLKAEEHKLKFAKYIRKLLVPLELPSTK